MKKPTFQGNNDLKVTDGFHRYLEVCSPSQIKNPDTGEMEDCHENIAANGRTMECIEKLVAWREAVYDPIVDKYPTKQQLKIKYDKVKAASEAMFRTFEAYSTPPFRTCMLRFIVRTCSNVTHLIAQLRALSTRISKPSSEPSLHQSGGQVIAKMRSISVLQLQVCVVVLRWRRPRPSTVTCPSQMITSARYSKFASGRQQT